MNVLKSMMIAAAGMKAQSGRMRVIAQNLANANTTTESPDEQPYRRQVPVFSSVLDRELGAPLVKMSKVIPDQSPFGKKYQPGHPAADELGYVQVPNVNGLVEVMDMKEAQRSFEANLRVVEASRSMITGIIGLLRRS